MSNSHFLKDNLALIAGICLPVLLVLFFWIAMAIPKMTVPDPQYDLVYTADHYDYNAQVHGAVRLEVRDGTLRATFHSDDRHTYRSTPRIFYFDVSAMSSSSAMDCNIIAAACSASRSERNPSGFIRWR